MVLVRNKDDGGFQTPSMSRFSAVIRPFAGETWALLVCVVATYVVILLVLSTVGPAPVHRRLPPRLWLLRLVSNLCVGEEGELTEYLCAAACVWHIPHVRGGAPVGPAS